MSTATHNAVVYEKRALPGTVMTTGIVSLVLGLALFGATYAMDPLRVKFVSIMLFMFLAGASICGLFMCAIEYIAGAVWSTPLRRIFELMSSMVYVVWIFALPALFNLGDLYHWYNPGTDEILLRKAAYLNPTFFYIRFAVVMGLWMFFHRMFTSNSYKQDETRDQRLTAKNIKLAAIFIPVFGLSLTALAIDFLMSLEPHWFSTMFGVNFFAGSLITALAIISIMVVMLNEAGYLAKGTMKDHYYSLGFGMFAGNVFWTYTAFSQGMLIWYANIPEETPWFIHRWEHGWWVITAGLIFVHFLIPFFALIQRKNKRDPGRMIFGACLILFAHCFDLYWIVMPVYDHAQAAVSGHSMGPTLSLAEPGAALIAAGFIILWFNFQAKKHNLVAIGDPKLQRGLNFRL